MRRPGNPSAISMARMAAETKTEEEDRCAKYGIFKAIDDAYRDIDALVVAMGDPADFRNSLHPWELDWATFRSSTRFTRARLRSLKRSSTMGQIPTIRIGVIPLTHCGAFDRPA